MKHCGKCGQQLPDDCWCSDDEQDERAGNEQNAPGAVLLGGDDDPGPIEMGRVW